MTKGAERSGALATEAVWKCGGGRALAGQRAGDLRLQTADKDSGLCGGQTASGAWAGTAHSKAESKDIAGGEANAGTVSTAQGVAGLS